MQPEVRRATVDGIDEAWSVNGPPGLCVMFARLGVFGPIDLVVSGINPGANVGRAIYHSGTVGAALTARNGGISGVAVSQAVAGFGVEGQGWDEMIADQHWDTAAEVGSRGRRRRARRRRRTSRSSSTSTCPTCRSTRSRGWRHADVGAAAAAGGGVRPPRSRSTAATARSPCEMEWGDADRAAAGDRRRGRSSATRSTISYLSRMMAERAPTSPPSTTRLDGLLGGRSYTPSHERASAMDRTAPSGQSCGTATCVPHSGQRPPTTARGVHHTALISSDVARTIDFYRAARLPADRAVREPRLPGLDALLLRHRQRQRARLLRLPRSRPRAVRRGARRPPPPRHQRRAGAVGACCGDASTTAGIEHHDVERRVDVLPRPRRRAPRAARRPARRDVRELGRCDRSDPARRRYRASIDNIDAALVHLLAERFKITQAVGRYKAEVGLPPSDPDREAAADRPAAGPRRGVRARSGVHREVPALHRRRGDPPPQADRRRASRVGSSALGFKRSGRRVRPDVSSSFPRSEQPMEDMAIVRWIPRAVITTALVTRRAAAAPALGAAPGTATSTAVCSAAPAPAWPRMLRERRVAGTGHARRRARRRYGCLASHRTAAWLWGVPGHPPDSIELELPERSRQATLRGAIVHRPRDLLDLNPARRHQGRARQPARLRRVGETRWRSASEQLVRLASPSTIGSRPRTRTLPSDMPIRVSIAGFRRTGDADVLRSLTRPSFTSGGATQGCSRPAGRTARHGERSRGDGGGVECRPRSGLSDGPSSTMNDTASVVLALPRRGDAGVGAAGDAQRSAGR